MADDPLRWETLDTDIDYACPGFEVRRDDVRLPDGTETDYHYVDESPAVVILPLTPDGDIVIIEEWRQAVDRVNRGLPAGSMEGDEEPTDAAHRELREETGYEADRIEHLLTTEPSNGIANSVHHHFVAYDCEPTAEQELDANESIRVETVGYDEYLDNVVNDDLNDGRSALTLLQYQSITSG
ncbi:NUDIX hydrolase [Halonotius aquaticus]|uniref:NUDIX hydrolase n=1 Tax=Halonotius aquaticus TaxID=2216978 RepID=A0A3A6PRG7_9EURY|nr:NUDIX hydrolase [Halonotius aquaticus]RJX42168.1 NUDIX hydrolase [Halonotius aquaticus]